MIRGRSGRLWEITRDGFAKVLSHCVSPQSYNTLKHELAWTVEYAETAGSTNVYIAYIRNDSEHYNLVLTQFSAIVNNATNLFLQEVTGTPAGGSALVPHNRNAGGLDAATITAESAASITGLTTETGNYEVIRFGAAGYDIRDLINRPIVLPYGRAIALLSTASGVSVQGYVDMYYDTSDPQVVVNGSH